MSLSPWADQGPGAEWLSAARLRACVRACVGTSGAGYETDSADSADPT